MIVKPHAPALRAGHPLADGLERCLLLTGTARARDHSRHGLDAAFSGTPTSGAGPRGRALMTTAPASSPGLGTLPVGAADRAFSFLMRSPANGTFRTILGYGDTSSNNAVRFYHWTDDSVMFDAWNDHFTTGVAVCDDAWHHVAATVSGKVATLYVDGRPAATHTFAGLNTTVANYPNLVLGADPEHFPVASYQDWLDAVKVWSRPLSPGEVALDAADPFGLVRPRRGRAALLASGMTAARVAYPQSTVILV